MKKIISGILLLVFIASSHTVFATESTASSTDSCVKFTDSLYIAKDTWIRTAGYYDKNIGKDIDKTESQVARLQEILTKEGFTIAKKENGKQFGRTTAIAVSGLQNKYKAELLTSQGLTLPYGVLDEKGVEFLNQKYGCIEKSKISLKNQGSVVETEPALLTKTSYVLSGIPASTKLILSYTNSSGTVINVEKTGVKNGNGEIEWTAPSVIGTYKVTVKLDGGSDKAEFTLKVISHVEKSFSVISPASDFTSVLPGKNVFVRIAGTFANSEKEGATIVEIQNTTTNKKTVISTSKKISDLLTGANIKIPTDIAGGVYKVLVTYSTSFGSFTKESTTFSIVGAATSTSGGTSDAGGATPIPFPVLTLNVPNGYASVVAGKSMKVLGTFPGIPNSTKIKVYLKNSSGETFLKESPVYYCPVVGGDCYGIKSSLGMPLSIPATTAAGTYTLHGVVTLDNGNKVEDDSGSFTITK